ncbi:MAG: Ig-like domain-containing protein [Desulfuromonadaceae bacterium]
MCSLNFKPKALIFLVMTLIFMAGQATCFAETVTLSWNANCEPDLGGYKVYYRADSSSLPFDGIGAVEGASPVDVRNHTTATISGLDLSRTHYFAVTAYNTTGLESDYSNIVAVLETVPPSVSLSSPAVNTAVSGTVAMTAAANDNISVSMVEFYRNGALLFAGNEAPYTFNWDTTSVGNGSYTLMAKAMDSAGNVKQSDTVSVTVNNRVSIILTIADALLALQVGIGNVTPTTEQITLLDVAPVVNGVSVPNGVIDTGDAIVLLSKIIGRPVL